MQAATQQAVAAPAQQKVLKSRREKGAVSIGPQAALESGPLRSALGHECAFQTTMHLIWKANLPTCHVSSGIFSGCILSCAKCQGN